MNKTIENNKELNKIIHQLDRIEQIKKRCNNIENKQEREFIEKMLLELELILTFSTIPFSEELGFEISWSEQN